MKRKQRAVTFRSASEVLGALMKSDPDSYTRVVIDGFDSLATVDPKGFDCLICAVVTRRLRAGNFFVALEQLRAHLGRQDFEAAQVAAGVISDWLREVDRLGTLLGQIEGAGPTAPTVTYVM